MELEVCPEKPTTTVLSIWYKKIRKKNAHVSVVFPSLLSPKCKAWWALFEHFCKQEAIKKKKKKQQSWLS
jgi:hypothetical protein